ncbi:MAG: 30S ribosomal protein S8e [archaeon]
MVWQGRSLRKPSGARIRSARKKRRFEYGREATETKIGERKIKSIRSRGGKTSTIYLQAKYVNVYNPKTKKCIKSTIKSVLENPADPHYVRRNIITKNAVLDTEAGKVKVTNRPGQEGCVNAILLEPKSK